MFRIFILSLLLFSCSTPPKNWMEARAEKEFATFKKGISKELLDTTWEHCKNKKEFKRFQIIDSHVYGEACQIKNLLQALVKKYNVPNVDFIYYNEDRIKPDFFKRTAFKNAAPIFVSAKHKNLHRAILFSDWMYDIEDTKGGWNALIRTMNSHMSTWEEKQEKLFWRGTPWDGKRFGMYTFENWTTLPRGRLVHLSQQHPDLINAAFSQYPDKCIASLDLCKQILGEIRFVSWEETLRHKYQMAIDGVTCSFPATQWKLLSGCLTFKQDSPDIMYFYSELLPWKHYIPVRNDLSDLLEKIQWAKNHDAECKMIAQNARNFALTNLMPEHILEYCYQILVKYAALQRFQPEVYAISPDPRS